MSDLEVLEEAYRLIAARLARINKTIQAFQPEDISRAKPPRFLKAFSSELARFEDVTVAVRVLEDEIRFYKALASIPSVKPPPKRKRRSGRA